MLQKVRGFTIYELLMTLVLIGVLASLSIPGFSKIVARNRMSTEINALFHAIHVARKESIMRRQVVSICPSLDGASCKPGKDWSAEIATVKLPSMVTSLATRRLPSSVK